MATIDVDDVIRECLAVGMSPITIAQRFSIELDYILEFPEPEPTRRSDAEELGQAMVNVSWRCYEEAMNILYQGNAAAKLRLITQVIGRNIGLMQSQSPKALQNLQAEFADLLRDISTDSQEEESIYAGESGLEEAIATDSPSGEADYTN